MITGRLTRAAGRLVTAARHYDVSVATVAARYLWLRARRGMGLQEAMSMGLLDPALPTADAARVARSDERLRTLRELNPTPTDIVDDKAVAYAWCRSHGIPCPRPLATVTPPFVVVDGGRLLRSPEEWARFLAEELPDEFVAKPAKGMLGRDVEVFTREGRGFRSRAGWLTIEALHQRLCAGEGSARTLLQERVRNHPLLAELSGTAALQCTRIVTVVHRNGALEIPYACQKLIGGSSDTDNYGGGLSGNLVANVDVATGTLGCTYGRGRDGVGLATHDEHPRTGQRIAGRALPHWEDACALVRRAAVHALPLRAIGWDVAITPSGAVLVEGNSLWFCTPRRGFWPDAADVAQLRAAL